MTQQAEGPSPALGRLFRIHLMFRRIAILALISLLAGALAAQDLDSARSTGSTYVPLDSWVYLTVERLAALGVLDKDNVFLGLRPWTRTAIAESLEAAQRRPVTNRNTDPQISSLLNSLRAEFAPELALETKGLEHRSMQLESVYTRSMYISGAPLADSFHFGQTIINDFGRPYQQGYNSIAGFTARAEAGHFAFYLNGEYDHAPAAAAYPLAVRQAIAQQDQTPLQPATPIAQQDSFRLLDSYVSMTYLGQEISFGRQSLWWGPGEGGAMIFSDNAEPLTMLRLTRTMPMELPWVLHYLGPIRYDAFFGRLTGHQFPPSPFMHGEKFSFKPTPNLEFGFSRTAVFAGEGITPLTFSTLFHSYFSATSSTGAGPTANLRNSPGARHGGFDFSYRLPFLRNWLTLYTDSLVHDDVSPIDAPRRAAINPGIYLSHFPYLHRLDLRAEAVNTDPPTARSNGGKFFYWEQVYKDA